MKKIIFILGWLPWLIMTYGCIVRADCDAPFTPEELGVTTTADPRIDMICALDKLERTAKIVAHNDYFNEPEAAVNATCVLDRILVTRIDIVGSYT